MLNTKTLVNHSITPFYVVVTLLKSVELISIKLVDENGESGSQGTKLIKVNGGAMLSSRVVRRNKAFVFNEHL